MVQTLVRLWRWCANALAALFLLQVLVVIAGPPQWLTGWLQATAEAPDKPPRYVVVLDGGGLPSEATLLRTYGAAQFAAGLTGVTFVVALPSQLPPERSGTGRMRDELVRRGIARETVVLETVGINTHFQALRVRQLLSDAALTEPVVVVTSGFHLRRALLCFRKAGFRDVRGITVRSAPPEIETGRLAWLRYGVWNNWESLVNMLRELTALAAYKLKGWI